MPSLFLVFALMYTISFTIFPDLGVSIATKGSKVISKVALSITCSSQKKLNKQNINNR